MGLRGGEETSWVSRKRGFPARRDPGPHLSCFAKLQRKVQKVAQRRTAKKRGLYFLYLPPHGALCLCCFPPAAGLRWLRDLRFPVPDRQGNQQGEEAVPSPVGQACLLLQGNCGSLQRVGVTGHLSSPVHLFSVRLHSQVAGREGGLELKSSLSSPCFNCIAL